MATIFLSYRPTDGPQACRVYDWLARRFGDDFIFMDVADIPFAVNFPNFIKQAIGSSKLLIALIGNDWQKKILDAHDPVRTEIEEAIACDIPVLPVLVGNTPMPDAAELPPSIATIASQNAVTVGVLHDFNSHMQSLLPRIESILKALAAQSVVLSDPYVIDRACAAILEYLRTQFGQSEVAGRLGGNVQWKLIATGSDLNYFQSISVTLLLHKVERLADLVDLHFILSFWSVDASVEQTLAGWAISQLERTPIIPDEQAIESHSELKIRRSDEDAREVWKMVTDAPLRLSLAYVATLSPKRNC